MKVTKKQITDIRDILQQQRLKDSKLSKAIWMMIDDTTAPIIRYVDLLGLISILNPKLAEELSYNLYECPSEWVTKVELENWKVVDVKRNDFDSLLNVLDALDLLIDDDWGKDIC